MKEMDRKRIECCLEEFDTWRASGLSLKDWCALEGQSLSSWRARLRWEKRWRQRLEPLAPSQAFVRALPAKQPDPISVTNLHIELSRGTGGLSARIELPLHALPSSATWLREVLS